MANSCTSKGRPISVSFILAAPPAVSRLRLHSPGLPDGVYIISHVIAAHGDSVLINIETRSTDHQNDVFASDYFIYCAGDPAAEPSRPTSLSLLPPCYLTKQEEWKPKAIRYMDTDGTAILRSGKDEVLVAALDSCVKDNEVSSGPLEIELCLLRSSGVWEWELMRLPILHGEGKSKDVYCWRTDAVIPVGDRFLIWVDYYGGIIYSDVWRPTPKLRYISLPVEPNRFRMKNRGGSSYCNVCATNGGTAVRFVEIFSRCCCGCPGPTACAVSRHAFMITTWALNMDDMKTWDKVGIIDCDEIWCLPGYHNIVPRIKPEYPTVSLDDPDVLCFMVDKKMYHRGVDGDLGTRLIELDTRRMEVRSNCRYDGKSCFCPKFVASGISRYFDTSSCSRTQDIRNYISRPLRSTLTKVVSTQEMLATLRGIPDLARDDMLKFYDVLVSDASQFKYKSLLALPVDMRKDYCLLIGKLSSFDVLEGARNI